MIINFALDTDGDKDTIERVLRAVLDMKEQPQPQPKAVKDMYEAVSRRLKGENVVYDENAEQEEQPKRRGRKPKAQKEAK